VLAIGLAGAGIAVAGVVPQGFVSVSDLASDPSVFEGREVHVKAIVAERSISHGPTGTSFGVTDTLATLDVEYRGTLPEQFAAGRTVVVSGMLVPRGDGVVLMADTIQGGCASKYEPSPPQGQA
jgi:cytochrome c-type biogenesis protein CcmE